MSEKPNDINKLDQRSRVLAVIRRSVVSLGSVAPPGKGVAQTSGSEGSEKETSQAVDGGPPVAYEAPAGPPAGHQTAAMALPPLAAPPVLARLTASLGPESVLPAYLAARACERSRRTMRQSLERCARLMGVDAPELVPWHALRFAHTDAIRARLLEGGYSRETILLTLTALRGVLRQAQRMGHLGAEDYLAATSWDRLPKLERPLAGREITQPELDKLRAYVEGIEGAYGAFLGALFALLIGTGLRATEACTLPVDAFLGDRIRVRRKGGKVVELPLGDVEAGAVRRWLAARAELSRVRKGDPLLVRVQSNDWLRDKHDMTKEDVAYLCRIVAKAAGVEEFAPHDCRRTFGTRALRFAPLATVQWFMSHGDPKTTKRYDKREAEEFAAQRRTWDIWAPPTSDEAANATATKETSR